MINRVSLLLLSALILGSITGRAQDIGEAYNLSNLEVQGTARSMGFGNALGSVGGDFSSLSVNPAGIGIYRSSELTVTPTLRFNNASSDYLNNTTGDNNTRFNFNNFGLVLTNAPKGKRYDRHAWKAVSFGIGMNRVADFNRTYTYGGVNNTSSATQAFASDANKNPGNDSISGTLGYLGYQSYLINPDSAGHFSTAVPYAGGINQLRSVQERGGINELALSLGGNYKEKLMLGITVGIPIVNYERDAYYSETLAPDNNDPNPYNFNSFTYSNSVSVTGGGINAKIGAIYKFSDYFRIGAAFHSPTYYSLHDVSDPGITSNVGGSTNSLSTNDYLYENRFDYNLTTPWKGILSATFLLKTYGFITADYEYVDYHSMRYRYPGGIDYNTNLSYQQEADAINQNIKDNYQAASNFRIGAEGRISKIFAVRLGFGYYGNPYKNSDVNGQRIDLSGGFGFHFGHFFTDLAYVHSIYKGDEQPYNIDYSGLLGTPVATIPTATTTYNLNTVALTMGIKF